MSSTRAKPNRPKAEAPQEQPRLPREVQAKLDGAMRSWADWSTVQFRWPAQAAEAESDIEQARRQVGGRG